MTRPTQIRIPNVLVDSVRQERPLIRSWKDENGQRCDDYGAARWFVHLAGSTESLGIGPVEYGPDGKPNNKPLEVGDRVDIILRRKL